MSKNFLLFIHSVKNSRPKQLFHRSRLLIKRIILSKIPANFITNKINLYIRHEASLASKLPKTIFKPRKHLVRSIIGEKIEVGFLNIWRYLDLPANWHPDEMKKGTRLWLLNLHYMEFIEGLCKDTWFLYVKDWILNNEPYKNSYWLDDWNSYSLSIRTVVWMQQFELRGDSLSDADKNLFLRSLLIQIRFLRSNLELDIGGNHLIKNIKALLWASKFFKGKEADKWKVIGSKLLKKALNEQIKKDGAHFELSPSYHNQVFSDLLECYIVLDDNEIRSELKLCLIRMAKFLTDTVHPDGKVSLFGDGGFDMSYPPHESLSVFVNLIGEKVDQSRFISYPHAGYFGLRDKNSLILMDAGELAPTYLPAHGHGDALSFEWSVSGQRVLIDPGVYEYNQGQLRDFSRSTINHNTVTLNNKDQSEFWLSFRAGRRAKIIRREVKIMDDSICVLSAHDGYKRLRSKPIHTREMTMTKEFIFIKDRIIGGNGQRAISRFMLGPDIKLKKLNKTYFLYGKNLKILIECKNRISIKDTICFLNFGHKYKTKQLIIDFGLAPCSYEIKFKVLHALG